MFLDSFTQNLSEQPSYRIFPYRDVNPLGGTDKHRLIYEPNGAMRIVHTRLIKYLRGLPLDRSASTAAMPGNSPLKNALRHKRNRFFYLTDIHDAYQSVEGRKLATLFTVVDERLEDEEGEVYEFLAAYCLAKNGGLAVGLPASPDLFNFYAVLCLDYPLRVICKRYGITYTRYLDDCSFSANEPIGARKRRLIRKIIKNAGFRVNHRKSVVADIRKRSIVIGGVGLKADGTTFLSRHYLKHLRGLIHLATFGDKVSPPVVEGRMGVFKAVTRTPLLNRTELKLLKQYQQFRKTRYRQ